MTTNFATSGGTMSTTRKIAFTRNHLPCLAVLLAFSATVVPAHAALLPMSGVEQLSTGAFHSCALFSAGEVKCWGGLVPLGDGTYAQSSTPVDVVGLSGPVNSISAGYTSTCALVGGEIECWGFNSEGELGNGTTIDALLPIKVVSLGGAASSVSVGDSSACAVVDGGVKCWGSDMGYWAGGAFFSSSATPVAIEGWESGIASVSIGRGIACVVTDAGGVQCIGDGSSGALGNGTSGDYALLPVDVVGLSSGVIDVEVAANHACALTAEGGLKCWGSNGSGKLGNGGTQASSVPVDVVGLSSGVGSIGIGGFNHSCAILASTGFCWGDNSYGQLGNGDPFATSTPVEVAGDLGAVEALSGGVESTCALTASGNVLCWGANSRGQLGNNSTESSPLPVEVLVERPLIAAELSLRITPVSAASKGSADLRYRIEVTNGGEEAAQEVTLTSPVSEGLQLQTWACLPADDCSPADGAGAVQTSFDVPAANMITVGISGEIDPTVAFVDVSAEVRIQNLGVRVRSSISEPVNGIGILKEGFEN